MPNIRKDKIQNDVYYFEETEQEQNKRIIRDDIIEKHRNKKIDTLTRAEKDELLIALAKLHELI